VSNGLLLAHRRPRVGGFLRGDAIRLALAGVDIPGLRLRVGVSIDLRHLLCEKPEVYALNSPESDSEIIRSQMNFTMPNVNCNLPLQNRRFNRMRYDHTIDKDRTAREEIYALDVDILLCRITFSLLI
jgi:hypothetical protein